MKLVHHMITFATTCAQAVSRVLGGTARMKGGVGAEMLELAKVIERGCHARGQLQNSDQRHRHNVGSCWLGACVVFVCARCARWRRVHVRQAGSLAAAGHLV